MKQPAHILFKIKKTMALKPFPFQSAVLIAVIMLFVVQTSVAQYSRRSGSGVRNSWEFGFTGGASQFRNSINPNSDADVKKFNYWNSDYNAAITVSIIKNFSPKFSAEFEFLTTKLSGSWNPNNVYGIPLPATAQNLPPPFKTGINQFTLMFVPNLNKIVAPNSANEKWYLFVKLGIGASFLKDYQALYSYGTGNGYELAFAYGGGLSYTINEKIKLKLGSMWYWVDTDRLDGVHTMRPIQSPSARDDNSVFYFNIKERYMYPYIGMTYGFGQIQSKAHFIRGNNSRFLWFKPSTSKYRKRR
ncbi:MAG: hypothetical protein GZ094_21040 [Mariniphaga sp.]|nr:hypothetical protein [Mariniphaga sp.]